MHRVGFVCALLGILAGCSVDVPQPNDGVFLCDKDEDCADGYKCGALKQCVDKEGSDTPTFAEGVEAIAREYCQRVLGCCSPEGIPGPGAPITEQGACVSHLTDMMMGDNNPETNPNVEYHPDLAGECFDIMLKRVRDATCLSPDPLMTNSQPDACEQMTVGLREVGESCNGYDECVQGAACDCNCQWITGEEVCECEVCRATVGLDASCAAGQWCAQGLYCDGTACRSKKGPGASCNQDEECITWCDKNGSQDVCGTEPNIDDTCVPPVNGIIYSQMIDGIAGAYCSRLFECCPQGVDLFQGTNVTSIPDCSAALKVFLDAELGGDPQTNPRTDYKADEAAMCLTTVQNALDSTGCSDANPISEGLTFPACRNMIEGSQVDNSSCSTDEECQPGHKCNNTCFLPAGPNDTCSTSEWCEDGLFCDLGKCQAQRDEGAECSDNEQCKSQRCDNGFCAPPPTLNDYCGGGNSCNNETFALNNNNATATECVFYCDPTNGVDDCLGGEKCTHDPLVAGPVCRPTCDYSTDCGNLVCAYSKNAVTNDWATYRACVRPGEWHCAMEGYLPAWADSNGCDVGPCCGDGSGFPCNAFSVNTETKILTLEGDEYVRDIALVDQSVVVQAEGKGISHYVVPVNPSGSCAGLTFPTNGSRRGTAVVSAGPNKLRLGTTCWANGVNDCKMGANQGSMWLQLYTVDLDTNGCPNTVASSMANHQLLYWDGTVESMAASEDLLAVAGRGGSPMGDKIALVYQPNFNTLVDIDLSNFQESGNGRLSAAGPMLYYARREAAADEDYSQLIAVRYDALNSAVALNTNGARGVCEVSASAERLLWVRSGENQMPCTTAAQRDVSYSEGGMLGGELIDNQVPIGSLGMNAGFKTIHMSGSVVAWSRYANDGFEIRALDVTNCDMGLDLANSVVLVRREGSTALNCPESDGTSTGSRWQVEGFAIQSQERGMLSLTFAAACSDTNWTVQSRGVYSRTFFDGN